MELNRVRIRNKDSIDRATFVYDTPPGVLVESFSAGQMQSFEKMTDTFPSRFGKSEGVVLNPMILERFIAVCEDSVITAKGPVNWGQREWRGKISAALFSDIPDPANLAWYVQNAKDGATNAAYDKMYASTAALLVTLGEGKKTLAMLKRPFGRAQDAARRAWKDRERKRQAAERAAERARRGKASKKSKGDNKTRRSQASQNAEAARSSWLEYRLGWMPLLFDILNIMEATSALLSNKATAVQTSRSVRRYKTTVSRTRALTAQLRFNSGAAVDTKSWEYKVGAGCKYTMKALDDDGRRSDEIMRQYGLRLRDVPLAGWELVTLSFVVDRFIEVQNWLSALLPDPRVKLLGSWCTTVETRSYTTQVTSVTVNTAPPAVSNAAAPFYTVRTTVTREVGVVPSALPALNLSDLSIQQHLDHIALILGYLKKLR